jgi:Protein of unknown function (DUF1501)
VCDLKQQGLLNDTLVLWTTEFGRHLDNLPFPSFLGVPGAFPRIVPFFLAGSLSTNNHRDEFFRPSRTPTEEAECQRTLRPNTATIVSPGQK